jgi:hypothetical protein
LQDFVCLQLGFSLYLVFFLEKMETQRMMEGHMRSLCGDEDMMMLEAFIGTGDYSSSPLLGTSNSVQAQGGDLAGNGETALQRMLQHLVDERPENWTYVIFWQLSSTPSGDMWVFISLPSLASISHPFSLSQTLTLPFVMHQAYP